MREKYDVKVCCSTSLSLNKSLMARLHNNVVNAIGETPTPLLPKAIIFVLDDDLIKSIHHDSLGLSEIFTHLLKNLMVGIHCMLLGHKDNLPVRSKKNSYPTILWALTPLHAAMPEAWRSFRKKFNKALESAALSQDQMGVLKLLKVWNYDDSSLFRDRRYTAQGLAAYWQSVDSAFRHRDTFVAAKANKIKKNLGGKTPQKRQSTFKCSMPGRERIDRDVRHFKINKSTDKYQWRRQDSSSSSPESYRTIRGYARHPTPPNYEDY